MLILFNNGNNTIEGMSQAVGSKGDNYESSSATSDKGLFFDV